MRYASLPLFLRPVLYFTWRYFFKLGFLDGKPGLVWHFLQGGWYRFLVDAKIYEINHRAEQIKRTKDYELHPTNALATGVSAFSARSVTKRERKSVKSYMLGVTKEQ